MRIHDGMNKHNTALVIIDPVNSCAHENCETPEWNIHFTKIRKMLPRLNKFAKQYRKQVGGLVIVTTITPWTRKYLPENLQELYKDPEATYYSEDTTGFDEEFHTIEIVDTDFVVAKNSYDAFTNSEFADKLKTEGIRYIIMAGIFTDGCVLSTIINGFSKGYNFVILKDLIETTDSVTRQNLQKLLIEFTFPKMYGRTITSRELITEWVQRDSDPQPTA